MRVRKEAETAPHCPQCGDAMRLARKLPAVRPLSGLAVFALVARRLQETIDCGVFCGEWFIGCIRTEICAGSGRSTPKAS